MCTGASSPYKALAFQYDSAGNLTKQLDQLGGSDSLSATYAAGNRLQTIGGASYTYDLDGNVATRTTGGITTSFTYDHQSQLISVRVGADTTFYGYNAVGRLVTRARNNNSGTTKRTLERVFFWDADHLLAETDSTLVTRVAEYAYAPGVDRPLALLTPGAGGTTKIRYYHQDEVGNVIGLTDTSAVVQALEYTPWGELAPSTVGTVGDTSRVRWKGLLWEEGKTQLYYVRNRWYDAVARRFISEDPIGIDGGLNLYAFGGNDPVNHTDPYGLAPECISWWTPGATITVVGVETLTEQGYWSTFCYGAGNGGGGPSNSSPFTTEGGGAGGGSVGVTALTDSQPLQTRVCSAKQISFAVTAASDATLFLGGAGVVVRGLAGAARATRAANLIAGTPRLARTNRLAGAFADRRAAYWSIGHGLGQRVGGYYTLEEVQMSVAQVPEVSWRDFVPGFAAAKAYGEMKTACGY